MSRTIATALTVTSGDGVAPLELNGHRTFTGTLDPSLIAAGTLLGLQTGDTYIQLGSTAAPFRYGGAAWTSTASTLASSTDVIAWTAATTYASGGTATEGVRLLRSTAGHTSAATFTEAEAGSWTLLGQTGIAPWAATTVYLADELVNSGGIVYQASATFTSAGVFSAGSWTAVTSVPVTTHEIPAFVGGTTYASGEPVTEGVRLLKSTAGHTAAGSFTVAEAGNWTLVSQTGIAAWSATSIYLAGEMVVETGVIYAASATFTSAGAFGVASWTVVLEPSAGISAFVGSTSYPADATATEGTRLLSRPITGTSAATFTLAEAGNWNLISQSTIAAWAGTSTYMAGEIVTEAGVLYAAAATFTSTGTFTEGNWAAITSATTLDAWAASTAYLAGQTVLAGTRTIRRIADGTSNATLDAAEAATWLLVAQQGVPAWVATTIYFAGELATEGGIIYEAPGVLTSAGAFNAASWTPRTSGGLPAWAATTTYPLGQLVLSGTRTLRRIAAGTSGAAFDVTEAADWSLVSQVGATGWAATSIYIAGELVSEAGALYESNATFTSAGAFTAASWTARTYTAIEQWASSTSYPANAVVADGNRTMTRIAAGTSNATFDATEAAAWTLTAQRSIAGFVAASVVMDGEKISEDDTLWQSSSARLTGASLAIETASWVKLVNVDPIVVDWIAATAYSDKGLAIESGRTLRRSSAGTSAATFTAVEAASWDLLAQGTVSAWAATTIYMAGELVQAGANQIVKRTATGTSGAAYDATEAADWSVVNDATISAWVAATNYPAQTLIEQNGVLLTRTASGDSGATFDTAEAGAWTYVSQVSVSAFAGTAVYPANVQISQAGKLYAATAAFTSTATFVDADWTLVTGSTVVNPWATLAVYVAGELAISPTGAVLRRTADGTAGAAFDATEAADWTLVSQASVPAWVTASIYVTGELVTSGGVIYAKIATGAAAGAFDASLWTAKTSTSVPLWAATLVYSADQLVRFNGVYLRRVADGTAGAAFDLAEAGNWAYVSQASVDAYSASGLYVAGTQIVQDGNLYTATATFQGVVAWAQADWTSTLAAQAHTPAWAAATYYHAGAQVLSGIRRLSRIAAGSSGATFDSAEAATWSFVSQVTTPDWAAATYYYAGERLAMGATANASVAGVIVQNVAAGDSEATFDATEVAKWAYVRQTTINAFAATAPYPAGTQISVDGEAYIRTATGISGATFAADAGTWTQFTANTERNLVDTLLPAAIAVPSTGTGAASRTASPWGGKSLLTLTDTDAAVTTAFEASLGALAFTSGDTYQINIELPDDIVNANHVIRIGYSDAANSAFELLEIGTAGTAVVAGGTDAGLVTAVATVAASDRGDVRMLRVSLVLTWTGASGATPVLIIEPVYNLDGTAVVDATAVGSLALSGIDAGAVSEYASGSGLISRGAVTADPGPALADSIYSTEYTATGVFTLPSVGLNQIRMTVIGGSTVELYRAVITPQVGDTLNGVVDATYTLTSVGEVVSVISLGSGAWSVHVHGLAEVTSLVQLGFTIPYTGSELQTLGGASTTTYLTATVVDFTLGTAQLDTNNIAGTTGFTVPATGNYIISASIAMVDRGGTSTQAHWYLGNGTAILDEGVTAMVASYPYHMTLTYDGPLTAGAVIDLRAGHAAGETLAITGLSFSLNSKPATSVVLAGMATPTALANYSLVRAYNATGAQAINTNDATFAGAAVVDLSLAVSRQNDSFAVASNVITVPNDGNYSVSFRPGLNDTGGADTRYTLFMGVNGAEYTSTQATLTAGFMAGDIINVPLFGLTAGVSTIEFRLGTTTGEQVDLYSFELSIEQKVVSTVVNPLAVPVTSLHRARARQTGVVTTVVGDNDIVMNVEDYDVGNVSSAGIVTIVNSGNYTLNASGGNNSVYQSTGPAYPHFTETYIKVNGVKAIRHRKQLGRAEAQADTMHVSTDYELVAGDTVQMGLHVTSIGPTGFLDLATLLGSVLSTKTLFTGTTTTITGATTSIPQPIWGDILSIGALSIGAETEVTGTIQGGSTVDVASTCVTGGNVEAVGSISLGASSTTAGAVHGGSTVDLLAAGVVTGAINATGVITLGAGASAGTQTTGVAAPVIADQTAAVTAAIDTLAALTATNTLTTAAGILATGAVITPGVYTTAAFLSVSAAAIITLDCQGRDAKFVFNIGSYFSAAAGAEIRVVNATDNVQVIWSVGTYAAIATLVNIPGVILARQYVTLAAGVVVTNPGNFCARVFANTYMTLATTVTVGSGEDCRGTYVSTTDTDGDGITDFDEIALGTNPALADSDADGVSDSAEVTALTDPNTALADQCVLSIRQNPSSSVVSLVVDPTYTEATTLAYSTASQASTDIQSNTIQSVAVPEVDAWHTGVPATTARLVMSGALFSESTNITVGNESYTCLQAGRYSLTAVIGWIETSNGPRYFAGAYKNGATVLAVSPAQQNSTSVHGATTVVWEGTLAVNDVIDIRFGADTAGALDIKTWSSSLTQLPTTEVVIPGSLTAVTLHRAKYARVSAQATLAGSDTDVVLETPEYNVGAIAAGGIVTIAQPGTYTLVGRAGNVTASNNSQVYIKVNGTVVARAVNAQSSSGDVDVQTVVSTHDLSIGDTVTLGVFTPSTDNTNTALSDRPTLEVTQLADSEVVEPSSVPVVDRRVLLGTLTGAVNASSVTISQAWGTLAATYETVEVQLTPKNAGTNIRLSSTIETADWADSTSTFLYHNGSSSLSLSQMDIAGSTANVAFSGTNAWNGSTVSVYGIKPQQSVINVTDAVVDDKTASGYFDIGTMRIQWGTTTATGGSVTYPVAFASVPVITPSMPDAPTGDRIANLSSLTTTGFTLNSWNTGANGVSNVGETVTWIAIGTKA